MSKYAIGMLFLAGFLLTGASCEPDACTVGDTRCRLNRAQICGSDYVWRDNLNCDELGGETVNWTCCWMPEDTDAGVPAGHGCLPGMTCPGAVP